MAKYGLTLKDHIKETHQFNTRVIWSWVFAVIGIGIIVWRLIDLQIIHHKQYFNLSEENRINILPLPPTRGLIYDRNGVLLADNLPTFTLEIIPERVKNIADTIEKIREIVAVSTSEIDRFLKTAKRRRFESVPLRFKLTEEETAKFSVNRHRFPPGVEIKARINRHYILPEITSHILGYVGRIDDRDMSKINDDPNYKGSLYIGKKGVEKFYEKILHGNVGYQQNQTDARGRKLDEIGRTPPKPGQDIYLTIDIELQKVAAKALEGKRGAVVAINPNNGEVLVLASVPGFDANPFVNGIDRKSYKQLQDPWWRPLYNRALQGRYPPGSTIKPFMALAGLELGVADPIQQKYCRGWYNLPGLSHRYRDWKKKGHGKVDINKAIVQSCDVYFYDLAVDIGIKRLSQYLSQFGFGQPTHVDLTDEKRGILPSPQWKRQNRGQSWYLGETVITGIGQGYWLITPLQLATATATLAARGVRYQPRVVYAVRDAQSNALKKQHSFQHSSIATTQTKNWDIVIQAMHDAVHTPRGTAYGRVGRHVKYKLGGKTGTAQVFSVKQSQDHTKMKDVPEHLKDHALFIAFAPVENPSIAIAVVVENGGHGSSGAAPIAKALLDQYFGQKSS